MAKVVFLMISAVTIIAALGVVSLPNVFHAALALVLALLGVAGLYALLGAGYLAAVQILVYVGAVSILIILAVMVSERFMGRRLTVASEQWWVNAIVGGILLVLLTYISVSVAWPVVSASPPLDMVSRLGEALMKEYLLPFEVASIVLLASLIGAVYIARER